MGASNMSDSVSKRRRSAQAKYAQGDILIEKLAESVGLEDAEQVAADPDGLVVLGRDEKSGHRHAVHGAADLLRVEPPHRTGVPDELYVGHLVVRGQGAELRHEEHAAIELPPGTYRVRRQRVFTARSLRLVRD
jgi:hypothetical protein